MVWLILYPSRGKANAKNNEYQGIGFRLTLSHAYKKVVFIKVINLYHFAYENYVKTKISIVHLLPEILLLAT